jgi:Ca2+-transporting ATPase
VAVVPGDLLVLAEGDLVAADSEVIESAALLVDWATQTVAALLVAGAKLGLRLPDLSAAAPRVAEFPFDSLRKRMTTVLASGYAFEVICKGAPELLLHDNLMAEDAVSLERAAVVAHELAVDGLRVLAVAARVAETQPTTAEDAETDLRLLGLIGIADPAKTSARETLAAIRDAGIELVLITGDHRATARCIAQQVGRGLPGGRCENAHQSEDLDPPW